MMMRIGYFRRLKEKVANNFHQHVRVQGESGMDTLVGTMIGVLFLAVISASFAGVYMAYTVSAAKADENTTRVSVMTQMSASTLNQMFIDSPTGRADAIAGGWTMVTVANGTLATVTPAASTEFKTYTFAATRPMVAGGTTKVSQWGFKGTAAPEIGLVKLYTAVPKAGKQSACNWTMTSAQLAANCVVTFDMRPSVITPPAVYSIYPSADWAANIRKLPWSPTDYSTMTTKSAKTIKLGAINAATATTGTGGVRVVRYVAYLENVPVNNVVTVSFVKTATPATIYSKVTVPTAPKAGETSLVKRYIEGTVTIPSGATAMDVMLDTKVTNPNTTTTDATDPAINVSKFIVYQTVPKP